MIINSLSFHTDSCKNTFLVLGERPTYDFNENFDAAEKNFGINFIKTKTKLCLSAHNNGDNSYLLININEIYNLKADNKTVNFPTQFCRESISNGLDAFESIDLHLKINLNNFSVNYSTVG